MTPEQIFEFAEQVTADFYPLGEDANCLVIFSGRDGVIVVIVTVTHNGVVFKADRVCTLADLRSNPGVIRESLRSMSVDFLERTVSGS